MAIEAVVEVDMNDARSIIAECRRLRIEKRISSTAVGIAGGLKSGAYRICETRNAPVSADRARRWLEVIKQMPEGASITTARPVQHKDPNDILTPTDPRKMLADCLRLDEARLLFLQTQAELVEQRIAQTRAALACFTDGDPSATADGAGGLAE